MSRQDVTDEQVVEAAAAFHASTDPSRPCVDEALRRLTGESLKVCRAAIERAAMKGLVDYGVSLRTCWPAKT